MYGKKRIIFRKNCEVVFAGEKSWTPMGWWNGPTFHTPGSPCQARLLKKKYKYTRPTADHMFRIIKGKNEKDLKEKIATVYSFPN